MSNVFHYEQRKLQNDLVILEPFNPDIHTSQFLSIIKTNPDVFKYISFPNIETEEDFKTSFYDGIANSPDECFYAILDKTKDTGTEDTAPGYAGVASLSATNPKNATTELGIIVSPDFQRTHVASNAIGLMLLWTLDPPSAGGLGLRRVAWTTHAGNNASRRIATRMGFEFEGIARWERVCAKGVALPVDALEKRNGTKGEASGRHTAIFSMVWDEWDIKRPLVVARMEKR
ncbi:acyl-CoA N-acyltransferase [Microthyrium microscopicum]|uniref:Acyl-CoA N-acyltransferase n=1 Tax=Microthyrium microscopicum TaxID=703497 RepID=A0A6A6UD82_9PEZI|nr:acyl-CoA N-acyltransferase [Microthyrium microscopicum]